MVARPRSEEDLVELWRSVVDGEHARAMEEADDAGMDVVHMQASQLAQLDAQQVTVSQAYYLLPHSDQLGPPAAGEARAQGEVLVERRGSGLGPRTIKAGVELEGLITDSMGVERSMGFFRLTEDLVFTDGDIGPSAVAIEASEPGYAGNVLAGTIQRFRARGTGLVEAVVTSTTTLEDTITVDRDVFNEGELYQFLTVLDQGAESYPRLITNVSQGLPTVVTVDPPLDVTLVGMTVDVQVHDFDELFSVDQLAATEGGVDGFLDEEGRNRNMPRFSAESDDVYRERLTTLADTISPNAIVRICARVLTPLGIRFHFTETGEDGVHGFILDEAPLDVGELCGATDPWSGSVVLNENDATRFFLICVSAPDDALFGNPGQPLDAVDAGVNAYDAGGPGDGAPTTYNQAIADLWRQVNSARAAGVNFVIVQDAGL